MPGAVFRSVMTPIADESVPPLTRSARAASSTRLYSVRIRMLDGIDDGLTGVMLLHDGRILGGDAFFTIRHLYLGERPLEGRNPQSGTPAGQERASDLRRP